MPALGELGGRRNDDQRSQAARSGPKVWLETCEACGRPVTIVAPTRADKPRCADCGPPVEVPEGTAEAGGT